ncbi:MAG: hypothetical protein ABIJ04_07805 [Bacteroidota bacterium]
MQKIIALLVRKQISILLLFSYAILLGHDLIPHHHEPGTEASLIVLPEHHSDNDHVHLFTGIHISHPASSSWEIIHFLYEQTRPFGQYELAPALIYDIYEFPPSELLKKPLRANQSVISIIEGITLSCGLRAPPMA